MSTPLASAHAIIRSRPDAPLPDLKLQLHHFSGKDRMAYSKDLGIDPHPGLTIGVVQLSPRSRGRLHIASPDANIAPRIYPDQFEDEEDIRSEEHTSELHSLMRISYADFCLKKHTTPT